MADQILLALDIKLEDKIIAIRENKLADANFVITSIMSRCFANDNNACLVILHNTLGHYQNVGKRLGYDLLNKIKDGQAKTVEPLKYIVDEINNSDGNKYLQPNKETVVKNLFLEIKAAMDELEQNGRHTTLFIDDISHLLDLGVDLPNIIKFLKYCNGLSMKDNISIVLNCHVTSEIDEIISNIIFHSANLAVTVSALKTGRSRKVSGVLTLHRPDVAMNSLGRQSVYHFKLLDKEIRTFAPGRAII